MTENAKRVLDDLVEKISASTAANFVRYHLFSDGVDIPCRRWSRLNQFAVFLADTFDARGIRQWNAIGRKVKKGAKAFSILVPMLYKKRKTEGEEDDDDETDEDGEEVLAGFNLMPVFRVEDTEGAPLDYQRKLKVLDVERLPLIEVAKALGVSVDAALTFGFAGSFQPSAKRIRLGTADAQVFLHELSHAVDYALPDRKSDYAFGEVVAELSSAFLGSLYGVPVDIPNSKAYIDAWKGKTHVAFRLMDALKRVEEIYRFIETNRKETKTRRGAVKARRPVASAFGHLPFKTAPFKKRSQTFNPKTGKWVKRDETTGLFCGVKKSGEPWRRVVTEMAARRLPDDDLPPAA